MHRLKQMVQGSGRVWPECLGGFSPDEGFGVVIVFGKISIDRRLQVDNRAEDTTADALPAHLGEEVLHRIEPGRLGRGKVKGPARMTRQPSQHFGMFMDGVVVEDDVDRFVGDDLALDGVEKADEFDVAVALHAAPDDGAVEHAERGEQGGSVPLVVVGQGLAAPGLDRQAGLGAVERLGLAFFIDRQHHSVGRRIDIEPDDIGELVGKAGVARTLERAQPMRLQFVLLPDALH
jgi:hypothetical protein